MTSAAPSSFAPGTVSRDSFWSLVYSIAVRLATLGITVAVARLAGPAALGTLGIALLTTALGSMIATFGLPQSLAKQLAETVDVDRQRALLRASGRLVLGFAAIAAVALALGAGWLSRAVYHDRTLAAVLQWCGPLVLATACTMWVEGALQGMRRFGTLARWGIAVSVFDFVVGSTAAVWGVVAVVASRALVRAVAVTIAVSRWMRSGEPRKRERVEWWFRPDPELVAAVGPLMGFAGPALLAASIVLLGQFALRALLVRGAGLDAAGHLQAADSIAQGLAMIPAATSVPFMRAVSSGRNAGYPDLAGSLQRALQRMVGFHLALTLVLIGVAPWAVTLVFGGRFEGVGPVLIWLAAAYGVQGLALPFGAVMLGRGEVWTGVVVNLLWAASMLVAFELVGRGHASATHAAIAILTAYVVLLAVSLGVVAPRWSISLGPALGPVLIGLLMLGVAVGLSVTRGLPAPLVVLVCVGLAGVAFRSWGLSSLPRPSRFGTGA